MNLLSGNKRKKLHKPSPECNSLGTFTDVAAGPLRSREESDIGEMSNKRARIISQDNSGQDEELLAPETSTPGVSVGDTKHRNDPTREDATDTREGEGGGKLADASKVPEGDYKNMALRAATTVSGADESGPLGPLKAFLKTIAAVYTDRQETVTVGKIGYILSRIVALKEHFYSRPGDVEEQRHRDKLIREFGRVERQLGSLSEKHESEQLTGHAQHNEEIVQQKKIHDQRRKLVKSAEATALNNVRRAYEAEYRHGDRKRCLNGTRGTVLDEIELWARDFHEPPVYWLNGLAETGKSTIAQTIAESIFADGQLGASFFCSRDFQDRRNLKFIFPTVAVQLARNYPEFRSIFVPLVQSDPEITHESLHNQMDKLIVRPLKQSGVSTVTVIDALDECRDEEPASAILPVLGQFVPHIPKVKFFVTEATDIFVLHNVEPSLVSNDIRLFFKHSFLELAQHRQGLDDWPTGEQLDLLCERAAGLFVYAAATIKFIGRRNNDPKEQLDRLLRSPESNSLYMSILQEAFGDDDPEDDHRTRSALGAVILAANPLSPSTIATLLGFGVTDVFLRLSSVHSLLILQKDSGSLVRPFHKSFPDFIIDPTRCINERFRVSPPNHHPELLAGCIEPMNGTLEKNMCDLPDDVVNCEVDDLDERTERHLDPALRYACRSWHKHLTDGHTIRIPAIPSALRWFLEKKFLFWLEVLSILGTARGAVDALDVAAKSLQASPTLDLVTDCFRFVMRFFGIISTSCPHIYHSALPLCPRKSIMRGLYEPHARPLARIVRGLLNSWESNIAAVGSPYSIQAAAWSPCSRFIAIPRSTSPTTTEILDGVTLERITTLESPLEQLGWTRWFAFSQNARLSAWHGLHPRRFISWDLQTGGLVSTIALERHDGHLSATYSACGTMLAVLIYDDNDPTITVSIYNALVGTRIYSHSAEGRPLEEIWTHGECLRFATIDLGSITIWEVGFTSPHAPTPVESLPILNDFHLSGRLRFCPTSRLACAGNGSIIVWDTRDSKFLLESTDDNCHEVKSMSFSSDGRFLACRMGNLGIYLWKESPTGYTLHQKLISNTGVIKHVLVSPNGGSIIASSGSVVQLWHTTDSTTSLSDASTLTFQRSENPFILGFSPDEALAVVGRIKYQMVTVLDLKSGIARLTIDTGMKVDAVGVARSSIVVVGEGKIVTWNLPAEDRVLNARANVDDSVLTTTFNHPPFPDSTAAPTTSVSPGLHHIAMMELRGARHNRMHIYDVPTGQCLASLETEFYTHPWFTLDGREVWCISFDGKAGGWKIIEDRESDITELEHLESSIHPSSGLPWESSCSYEVTKGGWVLSPSGKRLLWLPPSWWSHVRNRIWSGRLLALLSRTLSEPVILGLEE
ncbi:hypothetical protein BDM02DRAFT_3190897 [Thelephora ganbajun]|uniref:Uncharacterized protein n=1 Tax=Thelephora ganbajun TaxID=370292 RepID=A0ACB6Z3I1_THEGA|nr:hypothetical protein BDM02DRAFT_3190897 [Thelephora ganbajun]